MVRAVIAVVVIGGAGVAAYVATRDDTPPAIETAHYVNPQAKYSFDYPKAWMLTERGTAVSVTHPRREALVSFGLGAKGTLEEATAVLVQEITRNNTDVQLGEPAAQQVAGHDALAVNGVGTNKAGQKLRFLAVTVRAANRNFSIVIYAAANADPEQVVAPAQAMLSSFRPPGA
jgi:hypothetical protein